MLGHADATVALAKQPVIGERHAEGFGNEQPIQRIMSDNHDGLATVCARQALDGRHRSPHRLGCRFTGMPGSGLIFGILLTGLMLPYAVTLIPTFIFWQQLGAINTYFPLTVPAWFGGGAFNIFLLRQFFRTILRDLDEAAYLDGASSLRVLWEIVLPLSRPALIVVAIFTFIGVWNDFLGPLIYLSDNDKFTLALALASFQGLYNAQWGYLMAASTAVITPIVVLFFLAQRYFVSGIALTGIKG